MNSTSGVIFNLLHLFTGLDSVSCSTRSVGCPMWISNLKDLEAC